MVSLPDKTLHRSRITDQQAMNVRLRLLGDPVRHSISPDIYSAAFAAWDIDVEYGVLRVSRDGLAAAMRDSAVRGGNVTLPHKVRAASIVDEITPEVQATGACNCYWRTEVGLLAGANTDVGGLAAALNDCEFSVAGCRVLLLGAGGAARAALHTLVTGKVSAVEILNRTPSHAWRLANAVPNSATRVLDGERPEGTYDLVLNATRLGLARSDPHPIDLRFIDCKYVYDMVYLPGKTDWVRSAVERGIRASDGLGMLVMQSALSLGHWFPEREVPIETMRRAAWSALGEGRN